MRQVHLFGSTTTTPDSSRFKDALAIVHAIHVACVCSLQCRASMVMHHRTPFSSVLSNAYTACMEARTKPSLTCPLPRDVTLCLIV